jgi:parvulin-like peptidyl-prolyl isomerase
MRGGLAPLAAAALLLAGGCDRGGTGSISRATVVAMVGDRAVDWQEAAAYIRQAAGDDAKRVSPKVASSLLDQFLEEKLMERAVEEALPKAGGPTAADRRRELIGRRARLSEIDDALLRREWEARRAKESGPPVVKVSQLVLRTREQAEEARRRLERGEPWAEISRQASIAPNAATGGALGFLAEADLPPKFDKAIWGLRPGGITPILPATHGFHIFRVEERREARQGTFQEEAPALRLTLAEERSSAAVDAILAEARQAHPVLVVEEHVPFPYVGTFPKSAEGRR